MQAALVFGLVVTFGWDPVKYLAISSLLAVGLHPLGARWIQEHYVFAPGQETYSYYGPLNTVAFNIGYHNEHHDLMTIPWSHLPRVRATAPEFYDHLHAHRSWTRLLLTFLGDSNVTLFNRIVRAPERDPQVRPDALTTGQAGTNRRRASTNRARQVPLSRALTSPVGRRRQRIAGPVHAHDAVPEDVDIPDHQCAGGEVIRALAAHRPFGRRTVVLVAPHFHGKHRRPFDELVAE